jgi:hypothetical protein
MVTDFSATERIFAPCATDSTRHSADVIVDTVLQWRPTGANDTLRIDVAACFDEAIGPEDRAG